jgi:hypothetical protein
MGQGEEGELLLSACTLCCTSDGMYPLRRNISGLLISNLRKQMNVRESSEYISQGTPLDPHFKRQR